MRTATRPMDRRIASGRFLIGENTRKLQLRYRRLIPGITLGQAVSRLTSSQSKSLRDTIKHRLIEGDFGSGEIYSGALVGLENIIDCRNGGTRNQFLNNPLHDPNAENALIGRICDPKQSFGKIWEFSGEDISGATDMGIPDNPDLLKTLQWMSDDLIKRCNRTFVLEWEGDAEPIGARLLGNVVTHLERGNVYGIPNRRYLIDQHIQPDIFGYYRVLAKDSGPLGMLQRIVVFIDEFMPTREVPFPGGA